MSDNVKRQAIKEPSYITLDLSPQQERQLIAMAIRKCLKEALPEANNEVK